MLSRQQRREKVKSSIGCLTCGLGQALDPHFLDKLNPYHLDYLGTLAFFLFAFLEVDFCVYLYPCLG